MRESIPEKKKVPNVEAPKEEKKAETPVKKK